MRLYNIALVILPIINIALAAPVLEQENPRAGIDVVQIPNVLGKRIGEEELQKVGAEFFKSSEKSSDAHVSSSSAQPGPDHGLTNDAGPPSPNPEPSTANPEHALVGPGPSSSTAPTLGSFDDRIDKARLAQNAAVLKKVPDTSPVPMSGSFDDRITALWDKHEALVAAGADTHAHSALSPTTTSFDNKVDAMWLERYNRFLKNGGTDTNF